ncbi:MAG: transcription elongation factor GreA [Chloroflexota bacterium]
MDKTIALTEQGKHDLEDKLNFLKTVKRPEIAAKIGQAASDGDLSENGAYHNAKEEQGRLEGQIAELAHILRYAVVAEDTGGVAGIGKQVTVRDENGKERVYRLVSSHEVKPDLGFISDVSPIGSALMGHAPGETVTVSTPGRSRTLEIVSIE